jgi:hypothetical protein
MILGFHRDVDDICGLLGNYTASCGNYLVNNYHTTPFNYTEDHRFSRCEMDWIGSLSCFGISCVEPQCSLGSGSDRHLGYFNTHIYYLSAN